MLPKKSIARTIETFHFNIFHIFYFSVRPITALSLLGMKLTLDDMFFDFISSLSLVDVSSGDNKNFNNQQEMTDM